MRCIITAIVSLVLILAPLSSCESLPGNKKTQGAVIGGVGGAAAGAAISKDNRILGALIGGALGAGGGYLIGANMENTDEDDRDEAIAASRQAEADPATAEDARQSTTADLNNNGYITLDEVVAMEQAGLDDDEMVRRLRLTNQIFELTSVQREHLRNRGVSDRVIDAMLDMNRVDNVGGSDRISQDPNLIP